MGICEESRVGGTCVIRGCVPKKLLVYASHYPEEFRDARSYGYSFPGVDGKEEDTAWAFDWGRMMASKNRELNRLEGVYRNLLTKANVDLMEGRGVLLDPHTVQIGGSGGKTVTAERILVAAGGWPQLPQIPGIEHTITSNEALELESLPKQVAIIGAGFIACEFAGIFHGSGTDVTIIHRGPVLLSGWDEDVQKTVTSLHRERGIKLASQSGVAKIEKDPRTGKLRVFTFDSKTKAEGPVVEADVVLSATGRAPKVEGLGLENAGVKVNEKGAVMVDEWSRTSVPHIYAVGDVTDRVNLTPVALAEGHAFADTVFGKKPRQCDYRHLPWAVFSQPPASAVGLTEQQARKELGDDGVDVYVSSFSPLKHTITKRTTDRVMMKLVVDRKSDVVLGCHMVGPDAPEIIQGLAVALKCGARKAQFDATIGIHPTSAEEFVTMRTKRT